MKRKRFIIWLIISLVIAISGALYVLFKRSEESKMVPWQPGKTINTPYNLNLTQLPSDTAYIPVEDNSDYWLGEYSSNESILFPATHLPAGSALKPYLQNVEDVWVNARFKKGDTITVCMPWGRRESATVDSIIFEYLDYYDFSHHLYTTRIIKDTINLKYYTSGTIDNCIVMPYMHNIVKRYDFSKINEIKKEEKGTIGTWLNIKRRELISEWNKNLNVNDGANKKMPTDTIINADFNVHKIVDNNDSTCYYLVNCEWVKDPNNSSFGLYAFITLDSNTVNTRSLKSWIKYYDSQDFLVMDVAVVERDSMGNIGLLVKRGFWEARDVEFVKIDNNFTTMKSDTSYLTY
ncbi:MAG: hypothetical protein Q7U71_09905 [bacterium]|nr:hypothetical protein [bacterium]